MPLPGQTRFAYGLVVFFVYRQRLRFWSGPRPHRGLSPRAFTPTHRLARCPECCQSIAVIGNVGSKTWEGRVDLIAVAVPVAIASRLETPWRDHRLIQGHILKLTLHVSS